jgi:ketosteroid isomerase-like protein
VLDGFLAAWSKRDIDAAVEFCHPEIEIAAIAELVPGHDASFAGREGARRWIELIAELWDVEFRYEACERRVLDEHSVELVGEVEARSSGEHPDFIAPTRSLWKVNDGMLRRVEASVARETARDARQA